MATVYGMVTTKASGEYTQYALESFFRNTELKAGDRFLLIDNDGVGQSMERHFGDIELIANQAPLGFAANVNRVMTVAKESGADLFFLNNDLIFTPQWSEPLESVRLKIASPVSNAERPYKTERFRCSFTMTLEHYLGNEGELDKIAEFNRANNQGFAPVAALPFYCIKIPYQIYAAVGEFDEQFGLGGAEDKDYCIRAHLAGFSVEYALQSFVLHFQGRSTWRGAETQSQTQARDEAYLRAFLQKWGEKLTKLFIFNDSSDVDEITASLLKSHRYREAILRIKERD